MTRDAGQLTLPLVQPNVSGRQRRKAAARATQLPRLSITPGEAAEMLGVSRDFFEEHIKPELRIVRRGSKTILIPVAELERWLDKSATRFRH
jgi:excisionase family DNA binding protein